jgi:hypothetical protein
MNQSENGINRGFGRCTVYPWRELRIGETFEAPYCARCFKALIKQAEKSTRRKFEVVENHSKVIIRRTA